MSSAKLPPQDSPVSDEMKPPPQRTTQLLSALESIQTRISHAKSTQAVQKPVRLVAVSKLKPLTDIIALASPPPSTLSSPPPSTPPHYHFGENYLQELLQKSQLLPSSLQGKIKWHFIGSLQSNKAQTLARDVAGLWAVESVDSVKKANLLDKGRVERLATAAAATAQGEEKQQQQPQKKNDDQAEEERLRIFVQVNTSGEESKSGLQPQGQDLLDLCTHIRSKCPRLRLQGLMTIGAIARSQATTPETENEDFQCLKETRDWLVKQPGFGEEEEQLELSMGMSEDFEAAIRMGSDEVRVGSTIFGQRPPKTEAKVLPERNEGT